MFPDGTTASPQRTIAALSTQEADYRLAFCKAMEEVRKNSIIRRLFDPPVPPIHLSNPEPFVEHEVQELHQITTLLARTTGELVEYYQARSKSRGAEKEIP